MKTCKNCQKELPLESFHKHKGFKDGRRTVCRQCSCADSKKYYEENREKHMESCRRWQRNNRDKVKQYQKDSREKRKEIVRNWNRKNPERQLAHKKLNYAVFKGQVEKSDLCQFCGCASRKIEAHHYDYSKPLDVIWLCTQCHGMVHRRSFKPELVTA